MPGGLSESGPSGPPRSYGSVSVNTDAGNTEFYDLNENVTTNIYTINKNWRTLERALKNISINKEYPDWAANVNVTQLSTNEIIQKTTQDLKRLNVLARLTNKQQKLQVEKLTGDFTDAVNRYSNIQKQVAEKRKYIILHPSDNEELISVEDSEEKAQMLAQAQGTARELEFEQGLLLERESRVRQIEADVLDVNQIMKDLGAVIHQQGENIDLIENSIETATGNVEQGTSELQKAMTYQRRYRKKMCILLIIATIIVAALIWIIVASLHKSS